VELAVIAEVSVVVVLDAVLVSAAPLFFLPHAATARTVTDTITTFNRDKTIVSPPPRVKKQPLRSSRRVGFFVGDQGKKRTHHHITYRISTFADNAPFSSYV
jgi:hypothetical protein